MTNQQLIDEIYDNLINDSDNPGRMLAHIDDACEWVLQPGEISYKGKREIATFIEVAMASRGKKQTSKPTKVKVGSHFSDQDGDHYCIEFGHAFSFGAKLPGMGKKASKTIVQHCNIYVLKDGKIMSVHEYTSSRLLWLNMALQIVLKKMHSKVKKSVKSN